MFRNNNNNNTCNNDKEQQDSSSSGSGFDDGEGFLDGDNEGRSPTPTTIKDQAAQQTRKSLARRETRQVRCLRYTFLLILLGTALGVSLATYYYSRGVETDQFQSDFANVAEVIQRSFIDAVESRLQSLDTFSAGITSYANEPTNDEAFPNVTVPDWVEKGAALRTQTEGIYAFWLPLVTEETRAGFEMYTQLKQAHLLQSYGKEEMLRQYQDLYFNFNMTTKTKTKTDNTEAKTTKEAEEKGHSHSHRNLHVGNTTPGYFDHMTIHEGIWGLQPTENEDGTLNWIEQPGTGPYLPCWQLSPIIPLPALLNFNFMNYIDLKPMMDQCLQTGNATLSYLQTEHTGSNTEMLINMFMTLNQYRHDKVHYIAKQDPMTQVAFPVFDSLNPDTRKVAGLVVTTIFWRLLLTEVLSDNVKGVTVVLQNSLGEATTYDMDGKDATLVGTGDLHQTQYNPMGVTRHLSDYLKQLATPKRKSYTFVELDDGYTSYSIHVYPSQDMEDMYITNEPLIYAVLVGAVFIFTSLVFMLYDFLVERRQAKVLDTAVKSKAVVTSLFPEAVHERLFADPSKSEEFSKEMAWKANGNDNNNNNNNPKSIESLMQGTESQRQHTKRKRHGKPIADKFDQVSVLFADLAGFTKWSSNREPEHVFELLEALYGAFDKIALRRHVFKVETIGDCYMACTGLPNPQADHAPRMVKFARDCMMRMERLVEEELVHLGADTKELGFRVGIHSGPVTAGVLRGDKGRFQLFGDTVNTASRMESNGEKGRIHCSPSTAALLPERWITPRADKIVAKGKGEMQTYWVNVSGRAASSAAGWMSVGGSSTHDEGTDAAFDEHEEELERRDLAQRFSFLQPLRASLNQAVNMNFQDEELSAFFDEEFTNEVDV